MGKTPMSPRIGRKKDVETRRPSGGAKARLRKFFEDRLNVVVTSEELRKIGGASEWGRRLRELRNDEGMNIQSHNDSVELKPGQYKYASLERLPLKKRELSSRVRAFVLHRDGGVCQICGAVAGDPHPTDGRRTVLHAGHKYEKSFGGEDQPENLWALCSVCNQGVSDVGSQLADSNRVIAQIRKMPGAEQRKVLSWLKKKFSA